jgi:hypothetical protein
MRSVHLLALGALILPMVASAGFAVSSFKKTSRTSENGSYGAAAALDGDIKTAWVVDPENDNAGQWIEVDVPTSKIDKVSLIVGWAKDADSWKDHARLKEARLEVLDLDGKEPKVVYEKDLVLQDIEDRQVIDLPDVAVGGEMNGGRVRLTVKGVYPGMDFAALALGEMLVHLVEFDAATVLLAEPPSSEAELHDGALINDDDAKTWWAAAGPGEATFGVSGGRYSASSIGILPGPATQGRPKTIEVTQTGTTRKFEMTDKIAMQWFELPATVGYTGSGVGTISIKVLDVYPGTASSAPSVAEVKLKATVIEAF